MLRVIGYLVSCPYLHLLLFVFYIRNNYLVSSETRFPRYYFLIVPNSLSSLFPSLSVSLSLSLVLPLRSLSRARISSGTLPIARYKAHGSVALTWINHRVSWCFQVTIKGSSFSNGTAWTLLTIRRRWKASWIGINIIRTSVKDSNVSTVDVVSPRRPP